MSGTLLNPVVGRRRGGSFDSSPPAHSGSATVLSLTSNFTTFSNVAGSGQDWGNTSNAQTSNNAYASQGGIAPLEGSSYTTDYLKATELVNEVPLGATIVGILISIERSAVPSTFGCSDTEVKIVKADTVMPVNYANTGATWPTSDATATYGGSADLWSTTWTYDEVNAADFGVVLKVTATGDGETTPHPLVDHIYATIYYTGGISSTRRGHHGNCMT